MPFVVAEPCVKCKYTDCVAVCPVDCFREGETMLIIDPEECIDCQACEPACPVSAIFPEDEVPEKWESYIEFNERMAAEWPILTSPKAADPEADHYKSIDDKIALRSETAGEGD